MKIYDIVKRMLEDDPRVRSNDRLLIWKVWEYQGAVTKNDLTIFGSDDHITKSAFLNKKLTAAESITRARRKVQELHPHLSATGNVKAARDQKESMKGNFVFHED